MPRAKKTLSIVTANSKVAQSIAASTIPIAQIACYPVTVSNNTMMSHCLPKSLKAK